MLVADREQIICGSELPAVSCLEKASTAAFASPSCCTVGSHPGVDSVVMFTARGGTSAARAQVAPNGIAMAITKAAKKR